MRRSALAVLGTVIGTSLLVGAKLGHPAPGGDTVIDAAAGAQQADGTEQEDPAPSGSAAPVKSAQPNHTAKPGASPVRSSGPGPSTAPPTKAAPAFKDGTYTGPGVSERYGSITVTITVSGGHITNASGSCSCSGMSLDISNRAFNGTSTRKGLNRSTLDSQSADIATFSGATYTSNAYKQSLAQAIAKAKA
jgi:uncharacterized protein with FMN-binding domain